MLAIDVLTTELCTECSGRNMSITDGGLMNQHFRAGQCLHSIEYCVQK